ncbi:drug/metabolite transporter (DMT)-like permease [Pedobacter cryoconitis]|uniref:Drug/metabolite transporter (DMT)-like permease n=1 Tax=Pedobacter cryoconitis TaxID=188932 RepID=A0A7W8ZN92_9SPHI|nr:DMT family transporter [Pedobacter cryoconitis]MBB5636887.1 drug/metabolite transporter (DMT)-like permease [Pedobacter cryoconitis]
MRGNRVRAILWLIFIMLVWGSSYSVTKSVVDILPPGCFSFIRFTIALLCLFPVYLASNKRSAAAQKFKPGDWWWLLLMGITGISFYYVFFNYSLLYTSASSGALIQGFIPICIALAGVFFLKERLAVLQVAGILLSFTGVILVGFIATNDPAEKSSLTGNLFMLISVFSWATYTLVSRKLSHLQPLVITFWSGCIGTILLLPLAIYEFINLNGPIHIDIQGWLALVYLGAISSALCFLLYNKAIEQLPAAMVGNFLNLDILTGVLIAVLFLQERISLMQIIGGLLILSGLLLSSRKMKSSH